MTLLHDYKRVTKSHPCPICGRNDWCLNGRDEPVSRVICARVESKHRWGEAGWLHVIRAGAPPIRPTRRMTVEAQGPDLGSLADGYIARVKPGDLGRFARRLGVLEKSLNRLGIGWDGRSWAFPMRRADGRVIGIRLRKPDGGKYAVKGGREGLLIPTSLGSRDTLLVAEGPTDTAALLDLGFDVAGRPSCRGGTRHLLTFVSSGPWPTVVVVCDTDGPGLKGGEDFARQLSPHVRDVRLLVPPFKDAREWRRRGATTQDIQAAIDMADPVRTSLLSRRPAHG